MAHINELERRCAEIDAARETVRNAELKYSRGGGAHTLNKANRRLADAHQAHYEAAGGIIPEHSGR